MSMAPAVRKLLMIGRDNMLLRKPSLALLRRTNNKPDTRDTCKKEKGHVEYWGVQKLGTCIKCKFALQLLRA